MGTTTRKDDTGISTADGAGATAASADSMAVQQLSDQLVDPLQQSSGIFGGPVVQRDGEGDTPAGGAAGEGEAAADNAGTEPTQPILHDVVGGDTLWGIARTYLGQGARYPEIVALNTDKNLEPLQIGTRLRIPAANEASSGQIDIFENLAQHPAGIDLSVDIMTEVIIARFTFGDISPELLDTAADQLRAMDDATFGAVLNFLQGMGVLEEFLDEMEEDLRTEILDRAEMALTVPVTVFHGADASVIPEDFSQANEIYNPYGISVEQGNRVELDEDQTKAIFGDDEELDVPTDRGSDGRRQMNDEATAMLAQNRTAGFITGYWIKGFQARPGLRGWAVAQYASEVMAEGVVINTDNREIDTFAHELGHVLTQTGHVADADNLMARGADRNVGVDELTDEQIQAMKQSIYARFRG